MSTVYGATGMTKVSQQQGYSRDRGYTTRIRYVGTRASATSAFAAWVSDPAIAEVQWVDEKKGIIDVTYEDDDGTGTGGGTWDADSTWELVAQDVQLPLLTFGGIPEFVTVKAFNKDADQELLAQIKELVAQNKYMSGLGAGTTADVYQNLLRRGTTEYIRNCVILRQSLVVKRTSTAECRWAGVDRAWLFTGETGSPEHVPRILIGSVESMPDYDATKRQWLKRAPSMQQVGRSRFRMSQDWWFQKNWSYNLYLGTDEDGNP